MTTYRAPAVGRRKSPGPRRGGPRFGLADLLGPAAIASVVFVVGLWIRNQGLASLTTVDSAIGSLGLLAGLVSADLMLLQVVLLARIPWVERSWGHDVLTRRHRWIGFASFWLMTAHVVLFAVQRVTRDPAAALDELWTLFVTDAWMLFATVGTILLIMVVVTSMRAARRRLRYESWHLLHLYAYLGIAFTFPHMLQDGADFHEPWARTYWWTLYLFAAGVTVVYRLAYPAWRSLHHRLRVAEVRTEAPGTFSVTLRGHRLDRLCTESGQFFIWRFLDGPGWSRGNPYTLSAAPTADSLRITIKIAGDGSERAARLAPGTRVLIEGPYGTLTARQRRRPRMLMIAAGIGITPMRALLEDTPYAPGEATLLYRYTEAEHAVFASELREIAQRRGVRMHFMPGPRRADASWLPAGVGRHTDDAEALRTLVPDIADRDVYVCGPPAWLSAVRKATGRAGVHRDDLHTEEFAW
ncbi:ferredoxin reductase family protein [Streptomyces sp. NPDC051954]|uniref:ferredoxin reductase family protein n=1 Tax=Streptomyces sp. NPDC051954 TaxID=3155524 RepID=UPI00342EB3BB